jgi:hypothetical protein
VTLTKATRSSVAAGIGVGVGADVGVVPASGVIRPALSVERAAIVAVAASSDGEVGTMPTSNVPQAVKESKISRKTKRHRGDLAIPFEQGGFVHTLIAAPT